MANNWQPPQFGLPFPFPPPPQQQQYQPPLPDEQSSPSNAYQLPPANAFVPPPAWNIPGLNFQAHTQNAQQPQYPPAWPPNFPTPDQITQWNQMQMDMQQLPFMMMQNSPIPGLGFASNPPSHAQTPFQNAAPALPLPAPPTAHFPVAQPNQNPTLVQSERIVEVMDGDKEEGEVSEGDRVSHSPAINGRSHPKPPRSVPAGIQQDVYNPGQPAAGQFAQAASQSKATALAKNSTNSLTQQREEARSFIKTLSQNQIGYHHLAAEGLEAGPLRDIYRSLNLPSEPEPVPSAKDNSQTQSGPQAPPTKTSKPDTVVNTSVAPTKSLPSPANRQEYVARLQAMKKARHNPGTKATPPQKTPPPAPTVSKAPPAPSASVNGTNGKQLTEAEKKAKTTELIRKRIEALKNGSSSPAAALPAKPPTADSLPKAAQLAQPVVNTPAPKNIPSSPFANIPGLFMNSSPAVQHAQVSVAPGSSKQELSFLSNNSLPRDGSSLAPSSLASASNIKDLSKSHAVDAMDIDDDHAATAPDTTQSAATQNGTQNARTLPMIPGFPSRPVSVNPSVSGVSTPGPQTPSSTARSQELEDKERKMAALKERLQKKMEKMEEQKRQAEQEAANVFSTKANSTTLQNPMNATSSQKASLHPTKPSQSKGGEQVRKEPKRGRREEIEAQMPTLDAEIADNAAKLAQLTKEMEVLSANDTKMRRDKERLQAELESLGIDTDGMPHAELQAKKDEIEREQEAALEVGSNTTHAPTPSIPMVEPLPITYNAALENAAIPGFANASQRSLQPPQDPELAKQTKIPGLQASSTLAPTLPGLTKLNGLVGHQAPMLNKVPKENERLEKHTASKPTTPVDDEEDFYYPEAHLLEATQPDTGSTHGRTPSEEGEMLMSESEEDDYEPGEPQAYTGASNIVQRPSTSSSVPASSSTNEEEGPYEPPDVDQPMLDVQPNPSAVESELSVEEGEVEEGEMDMSTSSEDDSDSDSASETSDEFNDSALADNNNNLDRPVTVADDLAPELQPEASGPVSVTHDIDASEDDATKPQPFVPYDSPLKLFKSYRYHPNFTQEVPSGYLSMTYSHQIDPDWPLCATETSGATCIDGNCPDQHFRNMEITGEKLLMQLGTANPGKTQDEKHSWNDGLRAVLKELRQKQAKDPNDIAMEIANYRRQFLRDDTKVVTS